MLEGYKSVHNTHKRTGTVIGHKQDCMEQYFPSSNKASISEVLKEK